MTGVSISAQHLVKRYGGVTALSDGSLEANSGEVLALMGANGSGKSTLGKIVTGAVVPDGGSLVLDGEEVSFSSPQAARKAGIAAVYQELSLVPDMTVAENVWLANEPVSFGRVRKADRRERTARLLALFEGAVSPSVSPDSLVASLSPSERQIVEILKALSREPRVMILDEATASLGAEQVEKLFELIGEWKGRGMALIFVSHRMEEIFRIADRAIVLRGGRTVGDAHLKETTEEELVNLMIEGGVVAERRLAEGAGESREVLIETADLRTEVLGGVDVQLRGGEILGLGGLQGQGQSDLLLALFGAVPHSGSVRLAGERVDFSHPRQAMKRGVAFVPGDRGGEGLLPVRSIMENLLLPSWSRYAKPFLNMRRARDDADTVSQSLSLKMGSLDAPVSSLSGGNAQKVVLGKWLLRDPRVLLLDDPTKGVDVGAKGDFYKILADLKEKGVGIVLHSSDDEELLDLCDRVLVMRDGIVRVELSGADLNKPALVSASLGASDEAPSSGEEA